MTCWAKSLRFSPAKLDLKKPSIIIFWHSYLLPMWAYFAKTGYIGLVSRSNDGRALGELLTKWGYQIIYGSSSKGGIEALQELIEAAGKNCVLLTPDGPRGPREKMKPGAILAAQFANVPIYCVKLKYKGIMFKKSWDQTRVPLPFAKIKVAVSEPIYVATDLSDEQMESMIAKCEQTFRDL